MPFSIGWCTTLTGSRSRARASVKQPPSITSLTQSLPTDLMTTSTRERALRGGRDHRNPRPASIGTGGRLRPESPADFVGMRTVCLQIGYLCGAIIFSLLSAARVARITGRKFMFKQAVSR
jgi:hypothetical protein